jgi:hypothetical protein
MFRAPPWKCNSAAGGSGEFFGKVLIYILHEDIIVAAGRVPLLLVSLFTPGKVS